MRVSPVVFLNGARQCGKSTLVRSIMDEIGALTYVTFDRPTQMAAAIAAPEAFVEAKDGCMIIDEVQMVPQIFPALKVAVDEMRIKNKAKANGRYLLTGSANILALPRISDPLVGRMNVLSLYPYSTAEVTGGKGDCIERLWQLDMKVKTRNKISITDAIKVATFPEISGKSKKEVNMWFDGYLTTLLQRDVRMLAELEKVAILPHLLRLLATRAGNLLNDSEIARDAGLNSVTGKFYRNILKMMFLNADVPPWHRNTGKRLVRSAKGYLLDTLMLCYLLDQDVDELQKSKPELFGHVLENYIATELIKQISFGDTRSQLFHFRTSDGKEVDFVLECPDGTIFGIEVKKTESLNMHDFTGLKLLETLVGKDFIGGVVFYAGKEVVPFGKNLWALPFHFLWQ